MLSSTSAIPLPGATMTSGCTLPSTARPGMLEHAGILAARDEPLARFERWLSEKLEAVTEPSVRGAVE